MAIRTDPRLGYKYGWVPGDDDWSAPMNNNLELTMLLTHLTVLSDLLTAPPGGEAIGDMYIPLATATGAWAGEEDNIAIWWQTPSQGSPAWLFIPVKTGMRAFVQSGTPAMKVYNGSAWVLI